jgi:hypothetical protein
MMNENFNCRSTKFRTVLLSIELSDIRNVVLASQLVNTDSTIPPYTCPSTDVSTDAGTLWRHLQENTAL